MVRVIHPFHDKYSPEKIFYPGEYVIVEDAERLKDILERGLATEEEPEDPNAVVKTLEGHGKDAKDQGKDQGTESGEDGETVTTEDAKGPEQVEEADKDEETEEPKDEELMEEAEKEEKSTKRGRKK